MAEENIKTQEAQVKQKMKEGIPLWVSFLVISITAFVAALILLRI